MPPEVQISDTRVQVDVPYRAEWYTQFQNMNVAQPVNPYGQSVNDVIRLREWMQYQYYIDECKQLDPSPTCQSHSASGVLEGGEVPFYYLTEKEIMDIKVWDLVVCDGNIFIVETFAPREGNDDMVDINSSGFYKKDIHAVITPQDRIKFNKGDIIKSVEEYYSRIMEVTDSYYVLSQRQKSENPGPSMETWSIDTSKFDMMAQKFEYVHAQAKEIQLTKDQVAVIMWTGYRYYGDKKNIPRNELKSRKKYYFCMYDDMWDMYYIAHKHKRYMVLNQESIPKSWTKWRIIYKQDYDSKICTATRRPGKIYRSERHVLESLPKIPNVKFLLPN